MYIRILDKGKCNTGDISFMMGYKTIIGPTEPTRYDVLAYSLDFGVITKLVGREIGFLFLLGFSLEMCFMVVYFAMKMSCVCIDDMSL